MKEVRKYKKKRDIASYVILETFDGNKCEHPNQLKPFEAQVQP